MASRASLPPASFRRCAGLVRERPDEVAAFEDGLERVPDERIGFPEVQETCAAGWGGQVPGDIDEKPPASVVHARGGRQLEQREPEGLDRVAEAEAGLHGG
jgi:hypothetical protein